MTFLNNVKEKDYPVLNMGPRHRPQTRGPTDTYKQNHPTLPDRTARTVPIPERTHQTRNNTTFEKPICSLILLYQKEKQEALTSPRLPPHKLVDNQKPLPATPHPIAN